LPKPVLILESPITVASEKWFSCGGFHGSTWFEFLVV
jgi:hypothetical protein